MTALAKLAGQRATLTLEAGFESVPANGWERIGGRAANAGEPSPSRLARMRRRVDLLLADVLADEYGHDHEQDSEHGSDITEAAISDAGDPDAAIPGLPAPDGFWGPDEPEAAPASGYKSKHRLAGPSRETEPRDSRRGKARHAAPPASFFAGLGRGLASIRLTGHCAAHAA